MKRFFLLLFLLVLLGGGYITYSIFKPAVKLPQKDNAYFYINTGSDVNTVRNELVEQNYISGNGFNLVCKILKYKKAKPGRYKFSSGMSLFKLIKMLRSGNQEEVKMVINKERTKEIFAGKFGKMKKYDSESDSLEMIGFLGDNDSLRSYGIDTSTAMAVVMPYTYSIKWNSTPRKIFQQFYAAYKKFWTEERKIKADSLRMSPLEVITLASIVEEETNRKADKYNIASTYINRLKIGMKLQADPTIKFALRNFGLKRITGTHLATISPYNTYLNAGLPPGPICTPSVETIDAVLDAPKTDYLYFVASSAFDGSTIFTSEFSDHQKYAHLYQQELTRRMDSVKKLKATQ